ncbi:nucleotide pyrophosphatase [Gracilaria domingensis]|nr:nucleotide pyrophosphatase [Gracilaria domingensis]
MESPQGLDATAEDGFQQIEEGLETETLIPSGRSRGYYIEEPAGWHPFVVFSFVVFPACFGIGYYFFTRPNAAELKAYSESAILGNVSSTILISIDGFRNEYLTRAKDGQLIAPTLNKLAKSGVYAPDGMQPVMPSKTFPNHWSLATGLYPESHGIIGNTMYDPVSQRWFHYDVDHPSWWKGEPVWQTIMRTNKPSEGNSTVGEYQNYTTGCVFWPGSTVPKHRPDAFWKYNENVSNAKRVTRAVELLTGGASDLRRKAEFITIYFDRVDHMGHVHGPNSPEVNDEIVAVDNAIKSLLDKLSDAELDVNLVVLSDHGMTDVSNDRRVDLTHVMEEGTVQDILQTPMGLWLNMTSPAGRIHEKLQRFSLGNDKIKAYLKQNMPEDWHLRRGQYVTPVVTMTKIGWSAVYPHQVLVPGAENPLRILPSTRNHEAPPEFSLRGDHGFDHNEEDMQAIFLANGPAFKSGDTVKGIRAVDIYGLICRLYSAHPAPNNGSESILADILR